jgi:hypothetical protein
VLKYAWYDGSGWQIQEVEGGGNGVSLALDSGDRPYISHGLDAVGFKYVYNTGTGWSSTLVEPSSVRLQSSSIGLDTATRPYILYGATTYAYYDQDVWTRESIGGDLYGALALDGTGKPCFAYQQGGDLKYDCRERGVYVVYLPLLYR